MAGGREGRRQFLRQVAGTSAILLSRRGLGLADVTTPAAPVGPAVGLGVIGLGPWGREILSALARVSAARVVACCDTYEPFRRKAAEIAPGAKGLSDTRALLDLPEVEAVVVATPTHLHKDVAIAALQAGKHVYCEAPLASSLDEARAIVKAAAAYPGKVFQGGLQGRANALYRHVGQFVKSGVLGTPVLVSAHWGRKDSWRRIAPTPAREAELNWRLDRRTSAGLVGEASIHALDLVTEYLAAMPSMVTGFATTALWKDGRDVPDTVQCVLGYPGGVRATLEATLASSAGGAYTFFRGTNASLMVREKRAWLLKEADAPLLGWEVYARTDRVLEETGIALIADATKILAAGEEPGQSKQVEPSKEPLVLALESFLDSIRNGTASACPPREAFRATALALQADQATRSDAPVVLSPESLEPA